MTPELFTCPRCKRGYLELTAEFGGSYQGPRDKSPNKVSEKWCCASFVISPEIAETFRNMGKLEGAPT